MKNKVIDWFLRMVKGIFVGTGFILPGVSGGALAAIFGLYERLIRFMAHITKDFKKNVLFFIPVVVGMLAGIVVLSWPLGFFLEHYLAPTMWLFVGCIVGTLPSLWKQAGQKGRKPRHMVIMAVAFGAGFALLVFLGLLSNGAVPQNFGTWILAGAVVALGVLVPGLSPSNFLILMGMYGGKNDEPVYNIVEVIQAAMGLQGGVDAAVGYGMVDAFKTLDLAVLLPLALGLLACLLLFSKLMDVLFAKFYAGLFHIILGVVLVSTLLIVPLDINYLSLDGLVCLVCCVAGAALGFFMSRLEDKYIPEK